MYDNPQFRLPRLTVLFVLLCNLIMYKLRVDIKIVYRTFYRTSMMEGTGSLEEQLESTKVRFPKMNSFLVFCANRNHRFYYSVKHKKFVHDDRI